MFGVTTTARLKRFRRTRGPDARSVIKMPDALHEAKAAEFKLRQEMRAIQRDIRAARAEASSAAFEAQKRSEGQQMRDAINQQWLRDELSGIPAADEASVLAFSEACNARLAELIMMQEKGTTSRGLSSSGGSMRTRRASSRTASSPR